MMRWILALGLAGIGSWLFYDWRERRRLELEKQHRDDLLDEALRESFPASDPPALTHPQR